MRLSEFDPEHLAAGQKHRLYLELVPPVEGMSLGIPVLYARGNSGPGLAALAGIHGDEFEGVAAIHAFFDQLEPAKMTGSFLAVPLVNLPAASAVSRFSPIDHVNLARVFPGNENGTFSERLAWAVTEHVIRRSDLLLDLHSAGAYYSMPTLCGHTWLGDEVSERSRRATLAFGAPVIWEDQEPAPGRTLSAAQELGIPSIYAETTGGSWIRPTDISSYTRGISNVMKHLGILPGEPQVARDPFFVRGGGDLDFATRTSRTGFLRGAVELLDQVRAGDLLGTVYDLLGNPVEEIRAARAGYVMMRRETPMVRTGDMVYALAEERVPVPGMGLQA